MLTVLPFKTAFGRAPGYLGGISLGSEHWCAVSQAMRLCLVDDKFFIGPKHNIFMILFDLSVKFVI